DLDRPFRADRDDLALVDDEDAALDGGAGRGVNAGAAVGDGRVRPERRAARPGAVWRGRVVGAEGEEPQAENETEAGGVGPGPGGSPGWWVVTRPMFSREPRASAVPALARGSRLNKEVTENTPSATATRSPSTGRR